MPKHSLGEVILTLPGDGPDLATVTDAARRLGLNLDGFISRAVVDLALRTVEDSDDPRVRVWLAQIPSPR